MKKILSFVMVFTIIMGLLVFPASASTVSYNYNGHSLPYFDAYASMKADWPYAILTKTSNTSYRMYLFKEPLRFDNGWVKSEKTQEGLLYESDGSSSWTFFKSHTYADGTLVASDTGVIWSNFNVYSTDGSLWLEGDVNFRLPPLVTVVMETAEGVLETETVPALGGTMKILMVCGVGLVALLVVLNLFGKRSLLFRS